jgi:hypothetical protein
MSFWQSLLKFLQLDLMSRARRVARRLNFYSIDVTEPFPVYEFAETYGLSLPEELSCDDYEMRWFTACRIGAKALGIKTLENSPQRIAFADVNMESETQLQIDYALEVFAEELLMPYDMLELANYEIANDLKVRHNHHHFGVPQRKFFSSLRRVLHKKR